MREDLNSSHKRYHARCLVQKQAQMHVQREIRRESSMNRIFNGMPTEQLPAVSWQRSRRSNASGSCVELAELPGGEGIAIRNSRDPGGPALIYTSEEIVAFVLGVRDGDFDHLIP